MGYGLPEKRQAHQSSSIFFSERVIDRWNSLEQYVIDSAAVNAFKNGLRRTRNNKMGFFVD